MFRLYSFVLLIGLTLQVTLCGAVPIDFEPYQVIIDREIFGKRVTPTAVNPSATAETSDQKMMEKLAKRLTMCAVNRTPSGNTAVGFIDNEAKPPRNIYLNVGESADGYSILAADYDAETATIEKDGVTITLQLGKGLVSEMEASAMSVPEHAVRNMPSPVRRVGAGLHQDPGTQRGGRSRGHDIAEQPSSAAAAASYRARRQDREVQERALAQQAREAENQVSQEKLAALAVEIAAAAVRKQVLAEHGLEEEDLPLDEKHEETAAVKGEL